MKILLTMPGLFGDILTSLIAVRAVAEHFDTAVALKISHNFDTLVPLLREQPYISEVIATEWNLAETGPVYTYERWHRHLGEVWKPLTWPEGFDKVAHLQYRGWPHPTCYEDCARNAEDDLGLTRGELKCEPGRPWIQTAMPQECGRVVGNWRQGDYGEKAKFLEVLREVDGIYSAAPNEEMPPDCPVPIFRGGWQLTAALFKGASAWVGCQSAPWVLANGLGLPRILTMEPDTRRHDVTFWLPTPGNRRIGMNAREIQGALGS